MTESMDPYLYPGTDVLRNTREIRDAVTVSTPPICRQFTGISSVILIFGPGSSEPSISQREAPRSPRPPTSNPHSNVCWINSRPEERLRGTNPSMFAAGAGFFLGEINAIHPFREGNGRAQCEFIRSLGLRAGSNPPIAPASRL